MHENISAIRNMQIIATVKYHYVLTRKTKIKNSNNMKCWQHCRETKSLIHCWWEWKMVLLLWEIVWQSHKFKHVTSIWPSNCVWAIPKKWRLRFRQKQVISVLFIIAPNQNQPTCLSTDEWLNKQWYIHTIEYYSAINKKDTLDNLDESLIPFI